MANKWNTTDIEKISTAFTKKTIEKCFQEKNKISGDEIVTITEFPQINYFVLREIFSRWEADTERFRSPYFDFENSEVQKSFTDFKNTLSRNISVNSDHFAVLLETAVRKTLDLYMQPEAFFIADFRNLPDFKLSHTWLNKNLIFFKEYHWVVEGLKDLVQAPEGWVYANQALEDVKKMLNGKQEDFSEVINAIAEEGGLILEKTQEVVAPKPMVENDNLSFFEKLVSNPPKPTTTFNEREESAFERIVNSFPKTKEAPSITVTEPEISVLEAPEVITKQVVEKAEPAVRVPYEPENKSIFEGLNIPTLNDRLSVSEGNSLADLHQRSRIESLKGSMTLNQRFSFLNSLFSADLLTFESALSEAEQSADYTQAKDLLLSKYGTRFNWNLNSEDTVEFLGLVKRRFN